MRHLPSFPTTFLILLLLSGSSLAQLRLNVFRSFEDQDEISGLDVSPGVRVSQSTRYPTWRNNSLETVFSSTGGSIAIADIPNDWRGRSSLLVFAWSEQPYDLELEIADLAKNRYRSIFPLRSGANHIQMDLRKVRTMQWDKMASLTLTGLKAGTLYLDYLALHDYNPFLAERGRFDFHYKMDIETPHFKWAHPLDGGPISVYTLSGVIDGRAIIELAQRLQINFTTTTMGIRPGMNNYGFGEFYQQRRGGPSLIHTYIADDLYHGPNYDVILWPALQPWESYPLEVRREIKRKVEEEGVGLVLFRPWQEAAAGSDLWNLSPLTEVGRPASVWPEDQAASESAEGDQSSWNVVGDHFITRGLNLTAFPAGHLTVLPSKPSGDVLLQTEKGTPVLAVRQLGKGRVVAFGYNQRGMIPEISSLWDTGLDYPYWDYLWAMVAKATVWAAGREPAAAIADLKRDGHTVTAAFSNPAPEGELTGRLLDDQGDVLREYHLEVAEGTRALDLQLPAEIPGGKNFLDLKLSSADGSLDWASVVVTDAPAVRFLQLSTLADRVSLGESVSFDVSFISDSSDQVKLVAGFYDNYGRLLDQVEEVVSKRGETTLQLALETIGAASHLGFVKCRLESEGVVQDRAESEVFVLQKRLWDDFDIVMYLFGPDPMPGIWPVIDRQMRRMHVTTLSSYPIAHSKHANYMVQAQTRVSGQESPDGGPDREYYDQMKSRYLSSGDKNVLVRKYCLNDPAYRDLIKEELSRLCAPWVPFSPLSYYVYEEPALTTYGDAVDICYGEHCMRAMRSWLQGEYGSLESLNRQWGTEFRTWESVTPDDHKEAQARGNYSSWADHRTFMERTYANSYKLIYEELRKLDPNAVVLNSGTQASASHNGCDYSQLNQYTLHLNAYQYEVHRSMNPLVKISGGAGYGVIGPYVFRNFYRNLYKGANGGLYIFWQYCTIDPDLTLNQSALDMVEGFEELRGRGIGKLVGLAVPDNHGIAVHYSYPSIHGTWIVDGEVKNRVTYDTSPSFSRFQRNTSGWLEILRDSGLQLDFIAYSHLEEGRLLDGGYETLILPMSVALSDLEIDQIATFVENGGTVIADALPGVMDEHCAFRKSDKLQRVFGIQAPRADAAKIIAASGDPQLELAGAKALQTMNGKPALIQNIYGEGQAWLLNYFHHDYAQKKQDGTHEETLERLRAVLDGAGIKPKVRLSGATGSPLTGCERYLFNNGSTRLLGLVPDMERVKEEKVEIRLEKEAAIYDVREQRYLGFGDRFHTLIRPGEPDLFAFVGQRITGLDLQAPSSAGLGEEISLRFETSGVGDLRSVARVTVTDSTGTVRGIYGGNRTIDGSVGTSSFRTALNDPTGEWLVEVTEAASGERSRRVIQIN